MAGTMRVHKGDIKIRLVEREIVVAAVPEYDVGFLLGFTENGFVVDACVHYDAAIDMGLVLFPFLDGAVVQIEIFVGGKALDLLLCQIPVWHWMAYGNDVLAHTL